MRGRRFGGWAYGELSLCVQESRREHMRQSRLQFEFIRARFHYATARRNCWPTNGVFRSDFQKSRNNSPSSVGIFVTKWCELLNNFYFPSQSKRFRVFSTSSYTHCNRVAQRTEFDKIKWVNRIFNFMFLLRVLFALTAGDRRQPARCIARVPHEHIISSRPFRLGSKIFGEEFGEGMCRRI